MPRASPIVSSFNSGELSPLLDGRTDLSKYASGCKILDNFIPQVEGPAVKRQGTRFVREVLNSAQVTRLIPFEFSTTQAYILEFGNQYISVYKDNGSVNGKTASHTGAFTAANPGLITFDDAHWWRVSGTASYGPFRISGGTPPTGLAIDTDYWMRPLGTTQANISATKNGSLIEFTASDGSGTNVFTPYDNGTDPVPIVEIATAYLDTDVGEIQFTQSADVLYLAHKDYPPKKLTRSAHDQWTLEDIDFDWQPFEDENTVIGVSTKTHTLHSTETIPAAGYTPGVDIAIVSTNHTPFVTADIGRYLKFRVEENRYDIWETGPAIYGTDEYVIHNGNVYQKNDSGDVTAQQNPPLHTTIGLVVNDGIADAGVNWRFVHSLSGYGKILSITSTSIVELDVVQEVPSVIGTVVGKATALWAWGAWDANVNGYPRAVTFFDDRLWWAGSIGGPQTLWGSRTGDYENHRISDEDESALVFTINTDRVNVIEWLSPGRVMAMGTAGGEFVVSGETADEAITPTSIRIVRHSTYGSREFVAPARVENVVLFVQRAGRKLREFVFDFDSDSYRAPDLTILADHIATGQIKEMQFQQEPARTLWCVLDDGDLIALTYERFQTVVGWHTHTLGGTDVKVKSVAVIPNAAGDADEVWMIVERTVNSSTVRYVEYMTGERLSTDAVIDGVFMDSSLEYSGSSTTTLSGLDHLEGETVKVLATVASDSSTQLLADGVVSSGSITTAVAVTKAQVGLAYTSTLQTMRLDAGSEDGSAQGKTKRITNIVLRLDQTGGGLNYGAEDDISKMNEVAFADDVVLKDGDTAELPWPGGYETDGHVTLKHNKPLPCTIIAIMPEVVTAP